MNINSKEESIETLRQILKATINSADAVVIGAGAGLSTSAGFTYAGDRFHKYFHDFAEKYGFNDMYSGGFYPYDTMEEHWAFWGRYIYINRYMNAPRSVYEQLYQLVRDKEHFVLTTNVDHCFQKAGFSKERLFYTQGDYGLLQCSKPCHTETYDNKNWVAQMVQAQGYEIAANGKLVLPEGVTPAMTIPTELIPRCPRCDRSMSMNLRADDTFVQDRGWYKASENYSAFLQKYRNGKVVFLELGTGYNTPGIIKYSFWQMTSQWPNARYITINKGEAYCPDDIKEKAVCINEDIGEMLR